MHWTAADAARASSPCRLAFLVVACLLALAGCAEGDLGGDPDAGDLSDLRGSDSGPSAAEPDTLDEPTLSPDLFLAPTRRIAAGFWHTCALDEAGFARCWGRSEAPATLDAMDGALHYTGQAEAPDGVRYSALAAGAFHTCGLRADDRLVDCWGDDRHGESTPPGSRFSQIDAGVGLSCGVRADGSLLCWGRHADTLELPPGRDFVQVVVGKTWFDYPHNDVCALRRSGRVECATTLQPPFESRRGPFVQIALSSAALCGVHLDGQLECWRCPALQCVERDMGQSAPPRGRFSAVSGNNVHACALRAGDGRIHCWGQRDERVDAPDGEFEQISAGWFHSCGLAREGEIRCWGSDRGGQASPPL